MISYAPGPKLRRNMGTLLPLNRKEIGNELSLYYTQSTSLGERSLSMFWEKKKKQFLVSPRLILLGACLPLCTGDFARK